MTVKNYGHIISTMEAEGDAEATANFKLDANDFPNPFLDYEKKGIRLSYWEKKRFKDRNIQS